MGSAPCRICESISWLATCADERMLGERRCSGNAWQECGDYDPDEAYEWSGSTECPDGEICEEGYCVEEPCQDQCTFVGDTRCQGDGYQTCDDYDSDGSIPYADVEDFLSMCEDCFGKRPELTETAHNVWTDETGAVVLEARGFYVDHMRHCQVFFPNATTPEEAAQEYADGGDWHLEPGESLTLTLQVWSFGEDFEDHETYDVTVTA